MPNGAQTRDRIETFLLARMPFVSVRSAERGRVQDMLTAIAREKGLDILIHTHTEGLRDLRGGKVVSEDKSLPGALEFAGQQFHARENFTIVFSDVQHLGDDNDLSRRFLDLATLGEQRGGSVLVITSDPIWTPLQRVGMSVTLDTPDLDEMQREIREFLEPYRGQIPIEWGDAEYARAASTLCGVTRIEALNILATLLVRRSVTKADLGELSRAKDSIFSDLNGIERVQVAVEHQLGGLAGLQQWLARKRPLLTMDLRDRGMRPPRGVLLVGVPGCGKSLSAKAVAVSWELPLYRLDIASVLGQYVGQSEARLKDALGTADTMAPCVLWIDEIEKGLAGSGTDSTGITTRLVGQFLYWLQESPARVFVVATANDVRSLPQELLRSGRFDDMFFVDLPTPEERRDIIGIYLRRYLRVPVREHVVDKLVEMSDGFAGSDIESAVKEIGHEAIRCGDENVTEAFYVDAFHNVVPLSRSAPERIEEVRRLRDRAIPASGAGLANGQQDLSSVAPRRVVLG